jgi:hypothetical protein
VNFATEGATVIAGHEAKSVKGVFARQLLLEGLNSLDSFEWHGWSVQAPGDAGAPSATGRTPREIVVQFAGEE